MTNRQPNPNQQTLEEVRALSTKLTDFQVKITGDIQELATKIDMQPKIDEQKFNGLQTTWINCKSNCDKQFGDVTNRMTSVEKDVSEIKGAPGRKYEKIWDTIRNIVLGILITYLAMQFGIK